MSLKVVSLNCAGLQAHVGDIQVDDTIAKGDIIHLIETSLEFKEESPLKLQGYDVHLTSVGRGKGIATLYKPDKFKHEGDLKRSNMQITKYSSKNVDVINVYRSSNGNSMELLGHLTKMLPPKKSVIITGASTFASCQMARTE